MEISVQSRRYLDTKLALSILWCSRIHSINRIFSTWGSRLQGLFLSVMVSLSSMQNWNTTIYLIRTGSLPTSWYWDFVSNCVDCMQSEKEESSFTVFQRRAELLADAQRLKEKMCDSQVGVSWLLSQHKIANTLCTNSANMNVFNNFFHMRFWNRIWRMIRTKYSPISLDWWLSCLVNAWVTEHGFCTCDSSCTSFRKNWGIDQGCWSALVTSTVRVWFNSRAVLPALLTLQMSFSSPS